jgi:hypothetical protein|nr:MAG TPA: hypothetical protein [Caudoviricetes sp.]
MKVYAVISQWMDCDGDWIDRRVEKICKTREAAERYMEEHLRYGRIQVFELYE